MTWLAALLGAGVGLGLVVLAYGLFPPRKSLEDVLASMQRRPEPAPIAAREELGWASDVGRWAVPLLASTGLPSSGVRRDLAVLGRDPRGHLAEKATSGIVGLLLPPIVILGAGIIGGINIGPYVPTIGAFACAAVLFHVPDLAVHAQAEKRRQEMRHTLAALLDLTVISLAGGAGVDQSLGDASSVLSGWAATQLRRALETARLTRTPPWEPMARLGRELGVNELVELAATVSLAGTEGAKVRTSLASKASALRTRRLSDAYAAAQTATERMSLPLVLLFAGFLIVIGYPAMSKVLTGL